MHCKITLGSLTLMSSSQATIIMVLPGTLIIGSGWIHKEAVRLAYSGYPTVEIQREHMNASATARRRTFRGALRAGH